MAEVQQLGLRELLDLAQTALEEGRHQEATVSCRHVLREYPESATAMRLLGESYLEAGRAEEAGRAFEKVLTLDPFNVLARVGLGVLAEDRGEDERAIGQFRLAWEAAPHLPQLRSELVRLYRKRYGVGGRLRMTKVALANLHAHNEDLPRAIRQFQQLHDEEPARVDVAVALVEARWRHGDDEEAAAFCRTLLAEHQHLTRPLLILAAIQGDGGAGAAGAVQSTEALLTSARAFDPDAILARDLVALRPSATLQAFIAAPAAMNPFDPSLLDVAGTDELLGQRTSAQGEESFRWEDIAGGLTSETSLKPETGSIAPAPTNTNGLQPAATESDDVEALFAAIDRQLATKEGDLPPSQAEGQDGEDHLIDGLMADDEPIEGWETPQDDELAPAPDEPTAVERLTANWDNIDNELAAARPSAEAPTGMTGMLSALDDLEEDLRPFDVESDPEPELEVTLKFDPSKFSLPPLDGEDDDDLPLEYEDGESGAEIAPFNLDETGPRVKTGGLTFTDLVRNEQNAPTSYAAGNSFADTAGAEDGGFADITSIFATRELAPLPDDQLLDLQAMMADLPTRAPLAPSGLARAEAPSEPVPADPEPEPPSDWQGPERRQDAEASLSFESLLGVDAAHLELPEATYYPDATRPLLANDAALVGPQVGTTSAAPTAGDEEQEGMDNLFGRLRHRKQERIETGDLQVNRRLKGGPRPAFAPSDDEPQQPAVPAEDLLIATGAAEPSEVAEAPAAPAAGGAADLDDWIMPPTATVRDPDADDEREADRLLESGDDWLARLAEGAQDDAPDWDRSPATPAARAQTPATDAVERTDWGLGRDTPASPDDAMQVAAPEQPMPFANRPGAERAADAAQPSWADAVPNLAGASGTMPEVGEDRLVSAHSEAEVDAVATHHQEVAADSAREAAPYANGHHPELTEAPANPPPAAEPVPTTIISVPVTAQPGRSAGQRQTEQLIALELMVAADSTNQFARLTLAVAYSTARPEQALTEYRRLIKESDDLVPEVIERLKEMIADGDAPPRAHRVLGDAYMKLGQFDMAMAEFQRALSARPKAARA